MGISAKELRKALSPDVAELSAKALAELEGASAQPPAVMLPDVNPLAMRFEALWQRWEGPALVREYKFSAARRWRADYCHEASRTLIELEGGIYSGGRHSRRSSRSERRRRTARRRTRRGRSR